MSIHFFFFVLMLAQANETRHAKDTKSSSAAHRSARPEDSIRTQEDALAKKLFDLVTLSGRAISVAEAPSDRVSTIPLIAPGAPPLLSFRYFDGKQRHRFGKLDLVMDDAGH
jgi:hypothetical protein